MEFVGRFEEETACVQVNIRMLDGKNEWGWRSARKLEDGDCLRLEALT